VSVFNQPKLAGPHLSLRILLADSDCARPSSGPGYLL